MSNKDDAQNEVDIAVLQEQVKNLREKYESDHETLKNLVKDRDKALIWGILLLGSTVVSLAAWIFKYLLKLVP